MTDVEGQEAPAAAPPRSSRYPSTALALIGAVLGCLALVAFLFLVVVRPDGATRPTVDWLRVAGEIGDAAPPSLVVPRLADGWTANAAELQQRDDVLTWSVGFLSPADGFVAFKQGFDANDVWRDDVLDGRNPQGSLTIDGIEWGVIDRRAEEHTGNFAYTLVADVDGSTIVLHGTGTDDEFRAVATSVAVEAKAR